MPIRERFIRWALTAVILLAMTTALWLAGVRV